MFLTVRPFLYVRSPLTVCDLKWLGLRATHIESFSQFLLAGEPLTRNDNTILRNLERQNLSIIDDRYTSEIQKMSSLGKYELQCLHGHPTGLRFLTETFLPSLILRRDYF